MPTSYTHDNFGVNLTNFRTMTVTDRSRRIGATDVAFRASYDWAQETLDQLGLTGIENKMSSTLRKASNALQEETANVITADIQSVQKALKGKIQQTESLKIALETSSQEVNDELEQLNSLKRALESRLGRMNEKLVVATNRLQTRSLRPTREMTLDEVEKTLRGHLGLLMGTTDRIKRAIELVTKEINQLQLVTSTLASDARDKARAMRVEEAVLAVDPEGRPTMLPELQPRNPDAKVKSPFAWLARTSENVAMARHWLADSQRLRKAVRNVLHSSKVAEHDAASSLNSSLLDKINKTQALKQSLEEELNKVKEEQARANGSRSKLMAALAAQHGPLAQAKQRLELRRNLPTREAVADDVSAALVAEVAHLSSLTAKLSEKVHAADREIAALNGTAQMLEANIADKVAALHVDEAVAMADGRLGLTSPPPSSAGSLAWSSVSLAREATFSRIQELEKELMTARAEREDLEGSIRAIKAARPNTSLST